MSEITTDAWLMIECDGELYGLPALQVDRIAEMPPVTALPYAPTAVLGLVALGGVVLPLIDLGAYLSGRTPSRDKTLGEMVRLTLEDRGLALRVDRVLSLATVRLIDEETADWNGRTATLIDPMTHGLTRLAPKLPAEDEPGLLAQSGMGRVAVEQEETVAVLVVEQGGMLFALDLDSVIEIHDDLVWSELPAAPEVVSGVVNLRGKQVLVLGLGTLLGQERPGGEITLVCRREIARFALSVDKVLGIRRYPPKRSQGIEETGAGLDGYYTDAEGRMIGALNLFRLVEDDLFYQFGSLFADVDDAFGAGSQIRQIERNFIIFRLGTDLCALPVESVERVVEWSQPIALPEAENAAVTGAVEIGGHILPIAPLHAKLGKTASARPTAYIVAKDGTGSFALPVDHPERLISLPIDTIEEVGTGEALIEGITQIAGRYVWILAPDKILDPEAKNGVTGGGVTG
ncbi:chemotaxis protein CheW [Lacibacterium aquatile]|uniref:Chemotaxis protein CheW n=1 Tax=Lacibacterium aquatile TaxID=1168082 RepID=A0ABW5DLH7_9PROT